MRDMWVLHVSSKLGKQLANPGPVWTMVRPKASLGSTLRPETSLGNGHFIGLGIGMTHSKDWDSPSASRLRDVYTGLCPLRRPSRGPFLQRPLGTGCLASSCGPSPSRAVSAASRGPRPRRPWWASARLRQKLYVSVGLRSCDLAEEKRHLTTSPHVHLLKISFFSCLILFLQTTHKRSPKAALRFRAAHLHLHGPSRHLELRGLRRKSFERPTSTGLRTTHAASWLPPAASRPNNEASTATSTGLRTTWSFAD